MNQSPRPNAAVAFLPARSLAVVVTALAVIAALLFTAIRTEAASPTMTAAGTVVPGSSLSVSGLWFPARAWVQLAWDSTTKGMPKVRTTSNGAFGASVVVPAGATGTLSLRALSTAKTRGSAGQAAVLATLKLTVGSVLSSPGLVPSPTATPGSTPGASASIDPGLASSATPAPSATPDGASAAPSASSTATPPTATPGTSELPSPSATLDPTSGPSPTATSRASATPVPTPDPTPTPTPKPTATPTPTPKPTPTPTPNPTPSPTPAPTISPSSVPFGSRPSSGAISLSGSACQGVTISNRSFKNLGSGVIAISLSNCNGVTIDSVDFDTVSEAIFAYSSSNITVRHSRYRNITGPHQRNGTHRGNFVQFDSVSGFTIDHNKGVGGDTEDIVSLYKSGNGKVTYNQFQGTNWSSTSGTGIILGDGGSGSNVEVAYNVLDTPGQVGIQIIDGTGQKVHDNTVYSAPRPGQVSPNVGMSSYAGSPVASVYNNRVLWYKNDGSQNPYWWGAGSISTSGNDWHASLNAASLAVDLSTVP